MLQNSDGCGPFIPRGEIISELSPRNYVELTESWKEKDIGVKNGEGGKESSLLQ